MSRFGHVDRMTNDRMVQKFYERKSMTTGLTGRPKNRWEYDIRENIGIMEINNLIKCI